MNVLKLQGDYLWNVMPHNLALLPGAYLSDSLVVLTIASLLNTVKFT
jgi:hypothetical protein